MAAFPKSGNGTPKASREGNPEGARELLAFAPAYLRDLLGVNRSTWHRWRTGQSRIPRAAVILLQIVVAGTLPGSSWEGWRFTADALIDPAGQRHTPATIQAWHWTAQQLQAARAQENRSLQAGDNITVLPNTPARRITAELHRRLKEK